MSIISSFKKALGFPDEYDDEYIETQESDSEYTPDNVTAASGPATETLSAQTVDKPADSQSDISGLSGNIFDAVIELFNSIQPEFVKQCLSTEAQRTYIIGHIDNGLRKRIEDEITAARVRGEKQWETEKKRLAADLDKIKNEYNSLKQQREEFQSAQLSAARQKRALNERIHDLESKVNNLEAEKEQFQLENRSMLNKLRVANVRSNGNTEAEAEIQRLSEENLTLQNSVNDLTAKLQESETTAEKLRASITEIETSSRSQIEEENAAFAEIEEQLKQFEIIKKKKDGKITDLQEALKKNNAEISEARSSIAKRDITIENLQKENQSLRSTIEANLISQADAEKELRAEIEHLKKSLTNETVPSREIKRSKPNKSYIGNVGKKNDHKHDSSRHDDNRQQKIKISAIDELMESTDWFVAPDPTPLKKDPEVEEVFGYKEPVKKTSRDDDKQLSLW